MDYSAPTKVFIKRFIGFNILAWTLWVTIITFTDIISTLYHFYPSLTRLALFDSKNFSLVITDWQHYHIQTTWILLSSFIFIMMLTSINALLFMRAFKHFIQQKIHWFSALSIAFLWLIGIHLLFFMIDESFFQYGMEHQHLMRMGVIIINYLLLHTLYTSLNSNKLTEEITNHT